MCYANKLRIYGLTLNIKFVLLYSLGSVETTYKSSGSKDDVDSSQNNMAHTMDDDYSFDFNGESMKASPKILVNGQPIDSEEKVVC